MQVNVAKKTNQELLQHLNALGQQAALGEYQILIHLAEVHRRRLHLRDGHSSFFEFIRSQLKCSEATAYRRAAVVRVAGRFPLVLGLIAEQKLTLTGASLLAKHLTDENAETLLTKATHQSTRDIEAMLAAMKPAVKKPDVIKPVGLAPKPDLNVGATAAASARVADTPTSASSCDFGTDEPLQLGADTQSERRPAAVEKRVRIAFDAGEALVMKLERLKEVLGKRGGEGSLEEIFDLACETLLDKTDPERKLARKEERQKKSDSTANEPAKNFSALRKKAVATRYVPQITKDVVWRRDAGRCAYVSPDGKRCQSRTALQYDHVEPWAWNGSSHDPENIRLLCKHHNLYLAGKYFGGKVATCR